MKQSETPALTAFQASDAYQNLIKAINTHESPISFTGLPPIGRAHVLASLADDDYTATIITPDDAAAVRLVADINAFRPNSAVCLPTKEWIFTPTTGVSPENTYARITTLLAVTAPSAQQCPLLVLSASAMLGPIPDPRTLWQHTLHLTPEDTIDLPDITTTLTRAGYTRVDNVQGVGTFAVRGDILDIYPIGSATPYRIELWGDTIDTITPFDIETQRRITDTTPKNNTLIIPPAREFLFDPTALSQQLRQYAKTINSKNAPAREKILRDADNLDAGICDTHLEKYIPLLTTKNIFPTSLPTDLIVLCEIGAIHATQKTTLEQWRADATLLLESGDLPPNADKYYTDPNAVMTSLNPRDTLYLSDFLQGSDHVDYCHYLEIKAVAHSPWNGALSVLTDEMREYIDDDYRILLYAGTEKTLPILQDDLKEAGFNVALLQKNTALLPKTVYLTANTLSFSITYPELHLAILAQSPRAMTRETPHKSHHPKSENAIITLADISIGDLVVHASHGIGRYNGIRSMELSGITRDYIMIEYAKGEKLYVPVAELDRLTRYVGPHDDSRVRLSRLSSPDWQKTRTKARHAAQECADELLSLYAKREKTTGIAFEHDDSIQHDFESRFPYVETSDQITSIEQIKADMEKPHPMDRLLCGDVGFGKTEVALRAAMKCVLSSRQCAILVPTTVLAMQHYQTAQRRFEAFPVTIALLTRYITGKARTKILDDLAKGKIDIIIGTHAIVQKSIRFYNLGLAIIDEEQRFGVAHKERFKEMFAGVDMLTLSATPIPRTLNMAMSGIRDMSTLTEPPQGRTPVTTYVMEYNEGIILAALRRELARGGQAYYLINRIDSIPRTIERLQAALPEARILAAHGQMSETELSRVWQQLIEGTADILVCTTIIESGLDVPSVNTLIAENADRFGLSQMYQLRGRVGRSNRRAVAYFTYPRDKALTEDSTRRLEAMRQFTQFGSGLSIALRDLEIRGAGGLLSAQQHGHMEAVGYELYMQLLGQAVAEAKGESVDTPRDCTIDIIQDAHIPETYINSEQSRIEMYRKIATVTTADEESDLIDELIDRYGSPPPQVIGLIGIARTRHEAQRLGITEITQRGNQIAFTFDNLTPETVSRLITQFSGRVILPTSGRAQVMIRLESDEPLDVIRTVLPLLAPNNIL